MNSILGSKYVQGVSAIMISVGTNYLLQDIFPVVNKFFRLFWVKRLVLFVFFLMATRDLLVAAVLTLGFCLLFDLLLNETSRFCVLPERFKDYGGGGDGDQTASSSHRPQSLSENVSSMSMSRFASPFSAERSRSDWS